MRMITPGSGTRAYLYFFIGGGAGIGTPYFHARRRNKIAPHSGFSLV